MVGGGTVALRKIDNLLQYAMPITVVAPELDPKIIYYGERGRITVEQREYTSPEAAGYQVVIAASDDEAVNKQVFDDTRVETLAGNQ